MMVMFSAPAAIGQQPVPCSGSTDVRAYRTCRRFQRLWFGSQWRQTADDWRSSVEKVIARSTASTFS